MHDYVLRNTHAFTEGTESNIKYSFNFRKGCSIPLASLLYNMPMYLGIVFNIYT